MPDPAAIDASASLVLVNGKVVTVNPRGDIATALAVGGERILAVGSDADIRRHVGPRTRVIDLAGRTAIPGLIDGHAHLDREGLKLAIPSMAGLRSVGAVLDRIADLVRERRPGEWIVTMPLGDPPEFEGLPQGLAEGRFPTRHDLDRVSPDNPVFIKPAWGYWRTSLPIVSIANTRALERAGIGRGTASSAPSLRIDRDAAGDPTGLFIEDNVMPIVEFTLMKAAPGFDVATRTQALAASMGIYNSLGTTSVFEGHGVASDVLEAYRRVNAAGNATVRATLMFSPAWKSASHADIAEMVASWASWLGRRGEGDAWLRMQGLFTEPDETAERALRAAANPQTGWAGFNYDAALPRESVKVLLREAARNGIRVCGIIPAMLDLFLETAREVPIAGQRWVYGHIAALDRRQVGEIVDHGLCITTHTNAYLHKGGARLLDRIGAARENDIVPLRALIDAGVPVALATDNVPPTLWQPIWQAVARIDRNTGKPIGAAQALTRAEALRCATMGGAYLSSEEDSKGSLEAGKLADIAVLSQDPLGCALDDIRETVAEITIVGGKVVFDRADSRAESTSS